VRLLDADLAKVNDFYLRKLTALKTIWATLKSKVRRQRVVRAPVVSTRDSLRWMLVRGRASGQVEHDQGRRHHHRTEAEAEALQAEFHALYVEVNLLRDYSSLNYTGFSKILKKHDKTLPQFAMRRRFFEERINRLPVFGILDELYRLQAETQVRHSPFGQPCVDQRRSARRLLSSYKYCQQHVYASVFAGFNRLDVEISFGEALARATSEIQKSSGNASLPTGM